MNIWISYWILCCYKVDIHSFKVKKTLIGLFILGSDEINAKILFIGMPFRHKFLKSQTKEERQILWEYFKIIIYWKILRLQLCIFFVHLIFERWNSARFLRRTNNISVDILYCPLRSDFHAMTNNYVFISFI